MRKRKFRGYCYVVIGANDCKNAEKFKKPKIVRLFVCNDWVYAHVCKNTYELQRSTWYTELWEGLGRVHKLFRKGHIFICQKHKVICWFSTKNLLGQPWKTLKLWVLHKNRKLRGFYTENCEGSLWWGHSVGSNFENKFLKMNLRHFKTFLSSSQMIFFVDN